MTERRMNQKMRPASFLARIRSDDRGIALTEFAMSLPILLALILGGLETANYALAHLRISQLAMTVADNAGRVDTTIDEANIYEVFAGAQLVGAPIDFRENGRVVLSSLEENGRTGSRAGQQITWQRCWGELDVEPAYGTQGTGDNDATLRDGMGPSEDQRITAPSGTAVMFVEAVYQYQPLVSARILGDRQIRYETAFIVRERTNQNITNAEGLEVNRCD